MTFACQAVSKFWEEHEQNSLMGELHAGSLVPDPNLGSSFNSRSALEEFRFAPNLGKLAHRQSLACWCLSTLHSQIPHPTTSSPPVPL